MTEATPLTRALLLAHPPLSVLEAAPEELPDLCAGEPLEPEAARERLLEAAGALRRAALEADDVLTDEAGIPSPDPASDTARLAAAGLTCELLAALVRLERALHPSR